LYITRVLAVCTEKKMSTTLKGLEYSRLMITLGR